MLISSTTYIITPPIDPQFTQHLSEWIKTIDNPSIDVVKNEMDRYLEERLTQLKSINFKIYSDIEGYKCTCRKHDDDECDWCNSEPMFIPEDAQVLYDALFVDRFQLWIHPAIDDYGLKVHLDKIIEGDHTFLEDHVCMTDEEMSAEIEEIIRQYQADQTYVEVIID